MHLVESISPDQFFNYQNCSPTSDGHFFKSQFEQLQEKCSQLGLMLSDFEKSSQNKFAMSSESCTDQELDALLHSIREQKSYRAEKQGKLVLLKGEISNEFERMKEKISIKGAEILNQFRKETGETSCSIYFFSLANDIKFQENLLAVFLKQQQKYDELNQQLTQIEGSDESLRKRIFTLKKERLRVSTQSQLNQVEEGKKQILGNLGEQCAEISKQFQQQEEGRVREYQQQNFLRMIQQKIFLPEDNWKLPLLRQIFLAIIEKIKKSNHQIDLTTLAKLAEVDFECESEEAVCDLLRIQDQIL